MNEEELKCEISILNGVLKSQKEDIDHLKCRLDLLNRSNFMVNRIEFYDKELRTYITVPIVQTTSTLNGLVIQVGSPK